MTGEYQGKNIYVQNPLSPDKKNFCTTAVYLNEKLVNSHPKTSAFEIDLSGLKIGDPVFIKITHKEGCAPKIINPQVIRSKSKFRFLSVNVDAIALYWTTTGELPYGKFFIEHYTNKQWKNVATISGKGSFESNQYTFKPKHYTGENRYRIKYTQSDGRIFFSRIVTYFHDVEPVSFYPANVDDKITFSREAEYRIVDSFGNEVARGEGKGVNLANLRPGLYFLYIDNREEKFIKK